MKQIRNIAFLIASVFIIILAAHAGATMHDDCGECNQAVVTTQPYQYYVESGEIGLGYMLVNW